MNIVVKTVQQLVEHNAKNRLRKELLGLSDSILIDTGFSRPLLEQGVKGWPWRTPVDPMPIVVRNAVIEEIMPAAEVEQQIAA